MPARLAIDATTLTGSRGELVQQVTFSEEDARVQALRDERILDTGAEESFDDLALITAATFGVPIALVNFVDRDRQWFKARVGVMPSEAPRAAGFCACVVDQRRPLVIEDVAASSEWSRRSSAVGRQVRFYAGVPITAASGQVLGTVSIADEKPRAFGHEQLVVLEAIARRVLSQLGLRRSAEAEERFRRAFEDAAIGMAEEALRRARGEMEHQVEERTAELRRVNDGLRSEVQERQRMEDALRRSQEQLVQSQKLQAIAQLAGGIAHEFNNLLAVMFGQLSLLETNFDEEDPRRADIRQVADSADRAALLTRQLLAFSRHQRLSPQLVDLNTLVARQERMLGRAVGDDVRLTLVVSEDACPVRVDPAHVEQILLNLAINGRDAMPAGGEFHITILPVSFDDAAAKSWGNVDAGRYIALKVSDTGHGMTPDVQARIFEPFFTTKGVGKGTGLGLSTVYGAVAQSGGDIRVDSVPGTGTTFTILLPRVEPAQPGAFDGIACVTPRGSETILLVENEPASRGLTASALRRHGFGVLEAAHGVEALGFCARQAGPIHLVITDAVMPGMSGTGFAKRLLPTRPEAQVLYMSGYTTDPASLGLGLDVDIITKPFASEELLDRVRRLLDRRDGPHPPPA
jgi:signal transduction histidine kinase